MLQPTAIEDPAPWAIGWLEKYLNAVSRTRYPWSYHLMAGMFALTSIVGRRACVKRSTYTIWPPISLMLLGTSGVGKSQSISVAVKVAQRAAKRLEGFTVGDHSVFSPRGLMDKWQRAQAIAESETMEGMEVVGEMRSVLKPRTGNEVVTTWLIDALEHKEDFSDCTRSGGGVASVRGFTVSFGFCSALDYLLDCMNADHFSAGFMHRFFVLYERDAVDREEGTLNEGDLEALAIHALAVREMFQPGEALAMGPAATKRLELLAKQGRDEQVPSHYLMGFWNRYQAFLLKLSIGFTLAKGTKEITVETLELADRLLREHLYRPLPSLIQQLDAPPKLRKLFKLQEDVWAAGREGMSTGRLKLLFGVSTLTSQGELLQFMLDNNMVFHSRKQGRVYGSELWRREAEQEDYSDSTSGRMAP